LEKKKEVLAGVMLADAKKDLPQASALLELLGKDGIFVDHPLRVKSRDVNVKKLEERLLNSA